MQAKRSKSHLGMSLLCSQMPLSPRLWVRSCRQAESAQLLSPCPFSLPWLLESIDIICKRFCFQEGLTLEGGVNLCLYWEHS